MDSQEARIYTAILITSLVLGSILIYFFISIMKQQKRNLQLQKQNSTAEITAMETERTRIASDIHDEIGPLLVTARRRLTDIEFTGKKELEEREIIEGIIDGLLKKIRDIAFDLMPTALVRKGLLGGIEILISTVEKAYDVKIGLVSHSTVDLPQQQTINIFRIVQEVVFNALKHAKASEIIIMLDQKPNCLELRIADNGTGFDYHQKFKEGKGLGLRSIQNRVTLLGGKMFIKSVNTEGTSYVFEIPTA